MTTAVLLQPSLYEIISGSYSFPVTVQLMAYGGHSEEDMADMADLSSPGSSTMPTSAHEAAGAALAHDLVHQLGQFSLDSSPVLAPKTPQRKFTLRELEIQQTIGKLLHGWVGALCSAMARCNFTTIY